MTNFDQYAPEVLERRLKAVREGIERARMSRDSDADVEIIAVTKTHPVEAIERLYELGLRRFGASYVQEWQQKAGQLPEDIEWHFVGRLQSNKAKYVADEVAMVHSVDRKSVSKKLDRRTSGPVDVLLQVNLGMQATKGGVAADELEELYDLVAGYSNLRIRGLMGMPPHAEDPEESRPHFERLRRALASLRDYAADSHPERAGELTELSMGMTNDYEVAVEEGATLVRLGTALFGPRDYDE